MIDDQIVYFWGGAVWIVLGTLAVVRVVGENIKRARRLGDGEPEDLGSREMGSGSGGDKIEINKSSDAIIKTEEGAIK